MGFLTLLLGLSCFATSALAAPGDCSFENGLCGYTQSTLDQFDWSNNTGSTPSGYTGPTGDFTTGKGTYMYIETSWPRINKESAQLISPAISDTTGNCLAFYYHMNGYNVRTLNVYTQDNSGSRSLKWSLNGHQSSKWSFATFALPLPRKYIKIVFEGLSGTDYMGDIAIDDIKVYSSPSCVVVPSAANPSTSVPVLPDKPLPSVPVCGVKPSGTRIVGGVDATPGAWPWQAMLMYQRPNGAWRQFCGGTLITPDWVLTAAHCVSDSRPASYPTLRVRMGAHYINKTTGVLVEQDLDIERIYVNKEYNAYPYQYDNDIALIRLKSPAFLDNRKNLACLPDNTVQFPSGTNCYITGWGTMKSGGDQSYGLQQAKVPLVSKADCTKPGSYKSSQITSAMQCAGYPGVGGVDTCQGDSGGPLVCENNGRWYLVGITSWGYSCADPNFTGIYASVPALKQWVANTIGYHKK